MTSLFPKSQVCARNTSSDGETVLELLSAKLGEICHSLPGAELETISSWNKVVVELR